MGFLEINGKKYYVFPMSTTAEYYHYSESCNIRITLSTTLENVTDMATLFFYYESSTCTQKGDIISNMLLTSFLDFSNDKILPNIDYNFGTYSEHLSGNLKIENISKGKITMSFNNYKEKLPDSLGEEQLLIKGNITIPWKEIK